MDAYRLLVVDDNRAIYEDICKVLAPKRRGDAELDDLLADLFDETPAEQDDEPRFEIDHASQGQQGYEMVRAAVEAGRAYTLAFVDMRMPPGWDGLETLRHIWKADPDINTCICSAYSDRTWDEISRICSEPDRLLILKKPFDSVEIIQIAHAMTTKWSLSRQVRRRVESLESAVSRRTAHLEAARRDLELQIAQREAMEAELLVARKLEAVGQLAAGVAHEINTPVQYIGDNIAFLETAFDMLGRVLEAERDLLDAVLTGTATTDLAQKLKKVRRRARLDFLGEEVPQAITQTQEGVERVSSIVKALREFSHPGQSEVSAVDINRALETTLTVCHNEVKYVADVELDLDPQLPVIRCWASELRQVFLNLVVNAAQAIGETRQAGDPMGRIRIQSRRHPRGVELVFTDSGPGVPQPIRDRIFDPFFTTKEVGKGTGQGLAIARRIVDKHGGTLRLDTDHVSGARFVVQLPLDAQQGPQPAVQAVAS